MKRSLEIDGLSAIEHLLTHCPQRISYLQFKGKKPTSPRVRQLHELAAQNNIEIRFKEKGNAPVTAQVTPFDYETLDSIRQNTDKIQLLVALDHVQDPQNFGALCRSADALGASGIVIPKDRGVQVTPGVYHASAGAVATIPIVQVSNLGTALRTLKEDGFWIVGTSLGEGCTPPWEIPDFEKIILVLGTELEGLSPSMEKLCDWRIQIPLSGRMPSLNVSAAGAILMYEWARRIQTKT